MYAYFKGKITSILPNAIIIEVNGIGYQVIMANPYRFSSQVGQEARIWLYQSVSQDSIRLYGFSDEAEKDLFLHLISVSGIGPRSALSILSLGDHEGLIRAIDQADSQFLTKFPGVGKKTAQQIILDLQGKLTSDVEDKAASQAASTRPSHPIAQELEEALDSLGYSQRDIRRVVKQMDFDQVATTSDAIRQALRLMTAR
ncbi:Holliday junction branch migration protein RuvA [Aerococcus sp. UMB7834]|uniref:Holliday junction branch migration protein RuvA n=1 Tax=Aerococcus sp. UMB7834 TaxID=3046342 RepID=UPI00254E5471|nr:Holliday junction branch migration protein RuvA [Aerococcus sp. UMB7834]MDK6804584.1 Holliday junction branch migration protein RuvA [Aerococcus sp. UMB7834]